MVYTTLKDGSTLKLATFSPRPDTFAMSPPDAVFLSILGVGVIVLTFFVSRMVSAPLQQLSTAARVLAEDLDSPPVTEQGPTEVRQAIRAFNTMQERLRDNVEEKTRILASITHDLQTPMTRLRLRLEKVTDSALRSRLIDDLRSMQRLVRQGLEYHRGSEVEEPMVVLRLDSLLESVIDDASEGGADVKFIERANCDVEARPEALRRCFSNLIDNALKYGGQAEVYVR
jgi:signal transduction histidine kinase